MDGLTPLPAATPFLAASAAEEAAAEEAVFVPKHAERLQTQLGARWLAGWCQRVASSGGEVPADSASLVPDNDAVPTAAARLLLEQTSEDVLAAELYDLLGEGVFARIGGWAVGREVWGSRDTCTWITKWRRDWPCVFSTHPGNTRSGF